MDFYRIRTRAAKNGVIDVYPDFQIVRSNDIMVRGGKFYAIWDYQNGLWCTDEYSVQRLVDAELKAYADELEGKTEGKLNIKYLGNFSSGSWNTYQNWITKIPDNAKPLDEKLTFLSTKVRKEDYVSKRLPYDLVDGDYSSYDTLIGRLYSPSEREKIEWAIGAVISGDAKTIQKFLVLYGKYGSGKSTILDIITKIFDGYYTAFDAKSLGMSTNAHALESFRSNPLVAIQYDGDLSKIEDNTKLNSLTAHEKMTMNEKYKSTYTFSSNAFLFMASNKPVKITDAQSGLIRRLIDVTPSGEKFSPTEYQSLVTEVDLETGAIAKHCLDVYRSLGKNYYSNYRPVEMMYKTDTFFNFVEDSYFDFAENDGVTLARAYDMYKTYCDESNIEHRLAKHNFREELKNYFREFDERSRVGGERYRNYYSGFITSKFERDRKLEASPIKPVKIVLESQPSYIDDLYSDCQAQYANTAGTPIKKWDDVDTVLKDLDTGKTHFVRIPKGHIVIDFDLKNDSGEKDLALNLEAANKFPPTYSELSQGGSGLHLHYIYDGDTSLLAPLYDKDIEIKVYSGKSSLRRKLTLCNNTPVSHISDILPRKEPEVINEKRIKSEKALRELILRNLRKEIHPGTKPSIDFIKKILNDAYQDGLDYDVSDMRNKILTFAMGSTHHSTECVKMVSEMKLKSPTRPEDEDEQRTYEYSDNDIVFFDIECLPNLLMVKYKKRGQNQPIQTLLNPTPEEIEAFVELPIVGFNNRRYDNHILYGRYLGYSNEELYRLSKRIIEGYRDAGFVDAYQLSYSDVWDFSSDKRGLKKWEIELGLPHREMEVDWDQPLPESEWERLGRYCENDVLATEAVFDHRKEDWEARKTLASLSGLTFNHTTNAHATRIVFGNDKHPQEKFNYVDLSEMFPGYKYDHGTSTYRGEVTGEGGYVYSEPGMYYDVALLDVASMHPSSIEAMDMFGPYTKRYSDLKQARLYVKHGDLDKAGELLGDEHVRGLTTKESQTAMANALKIVINSVYGLTAAKFDNKFKDPRNVDNIVAKRGALFMIDLKHFVQDKGFTVAHIKTDSIKIPGATSEIIQEVMDFGKKYGYTFEHEATYDRICLVNNAVYIAHDKDGWHATGAQFKHPYVFKEMFSEEPIEFKDVCETKAVRNNMYLQDADGNMHFVGRVGQFTPVHEEDGGMKLLAEYGGKYQAVTGTKDWFWKESTEIRNWREEYNKEYFDDLIRDGINTISQYGDYWSFANVEERK